MAWSSAATSLPCRKVQCLENGLRDSVRIAGGGTSGGGERSGGVTQVEIEDVLR